MAKIVDAPTCFSWRYPDMEKLVPGKALFIPWDEIRERSNDPSQPIRAFAVYWKRQTGWKLRTRSGSDGVYVIRDE